MGGGGVRCVNKYTKGGEWWWREQPPISFISHVPVLPDNRAMFLSYFEPYQSNRVRFAAACFINPDGGSFFNYPISLSLL